MSGSDSPDHLLSLLLAAAEANDAPRCESLLDAWALATQPASEKNCAPLCSVDPALKASLLLGNTEATNVFLRRGLAPSNDVIVRLCVKSTEDNNWNLRSWHALLANGWDVNQNLSYLGDALSCVVGNDKLPLVRFLLDNGADPNLNIRANRYSSLEIAAMYGSLEGMSLLVSHGAEIRGRSALLEAARRGRTDAVRWLLAAGADVNELPDNEDITDEDRESQDWGAALHGAAAHDQLDTVFRLLERGADIHVKNALGLRPLEVAKGSSAKKLMEVDE